MSLYFFRNIFLTSLGIMACGTKLKTHRVISASKPQFVSLSNPTQKTRLFLAEIDNELFIPLQNPSQSLLKKIPFSTMESNGLRLSANSGVVLLNCTSLEAGGTNIHLTSQFDVKTLSNPKGKCHVVETNLNDTLAFTHLDSGYKTQLEKAQDRSNAIIAAVIGPTAITVSGIVLGLVSIALLRPQLDMMSEFVENFTEGMAGAGATIASAASEVNKASAVLGNVGDGFLNNVLEKFLVASKAFVEAQQAVAEIGINKQNAVAQSQLETLERYREVTQEALRSYLDVVNQTGTLDQRQKFQVQKLFESLRTNLDNETAYQSWKAQISFIQQRIDTLSVAQNFTYEEEVKQLKRALESLTQNQDSFGKFIERSQQEQVARQNAKDAAQAQAEERKFIANMFTNTIDQIVSVLAQNNMNTRQQLQAILNQKTIAPEDLLAAANKMQQSFKQTSEAATELYSDKGAIGSLVKKLTSVIIPFFVVSSAAGVLGGVTYSEDLSQRQRFVNIFTEQLNQALLNTLESIKDDNHLFPELQQAITQDRRRMLSKLVTTKLIQNFNNNAPDTVQGSLLAIGTYLPGQESAYLKDIRFVPERGENGSIKFIALPN